MVTEEYTQYLRPGRFINSDDPAVIEFSENTVAGETSEKNRVLALFYRVRDEILYDPYLPFGKPESYTAKDALATCRGWCVPKAALLAACARAIGIPARVGYADVKNHLATEKLLKAMGTDLFAWHSYADLYLNGRWIKSTPAFNKSMCEKFHLKPLDFDGESDSLFHEFDQTGNRHMEYVRERGTYTDVPFEEIVASYKELYPYVASDPFHGIDGDFQADAGNDQIT